MTPSTPIEDVRLVVIVGPTASGKSALAVRLAEKFNGEVISADSRQIYRGLEIGNGALGRRERRGVPHHLIGAVNPKRRLSAADFVRLGRRAIREIAKRGKIPFLVGGAGFWVDALAEGWELPAVPPDPKLRRRLAHLSAERLLGMLKRLDPGRARTVGQKNPRRLIRAIEIARALGKVPALARRHPYRTLWIGLHPKPNAQSRRIRARARRMLARGLVAETKRLRLGGVSIARIREFGFEYRATLAYLTGKIGRAELEGQLIRKTIGYARRQMTWFSRNPKIRWAQGTREAASLVRRFLTA